MVQGFTRRLKSILTANGFVLLRQGRGDHEIWHQPASGKQVVVDGRIMSRHTANAVLKQAGITARF